MEFKNVSKIGNSDPITFAIYISGSQGYISQFAIGSELVKDVSNQFAFDHF